jgi:N-acetylglutamate synthase
VNPLLVRAVEEASLNAWPAHQTMVDQGWLLRFAGGYTRRANSVNPIYTTGGITEFSEVREQIRRCEECYCRRGQPVVFKITPLVQPPDLDAHLDRLGYRAEASTGVWLTPLEQPSLHLDSFQTEGMQVKCETTFSESWLADFATFSQTTDAALPKLVGILKQILPLHCFITLYHQSTPVACGLGVVEGSLLGLFDIVTAASARGKGYGTQLLLALLAWGKDNGATYAYLQVMDENIPAQRLYEKLGFAEIYKYWYRVLS